MSTSPQTAERGGTRRINPTGWSAARGTDLAQLRAGAAAVLTIGGQGPVDAQGRLLHAEDVPAQVALAMANVRAVLDDAGMALEDLAHLRLYATDLPAVMASYDVVVELLAAAGATPPVTVVEVSALRLPGMVVEIDGLAIRTAP